MGDISPIVDCSHEGLGSWLHIRNFYISLFLPRLVIETLQGVSPDRRCFRMIGGVLVERTVREVLPALEANRDKVGLGICLACTELPSSRSSASSMQEKLLWTLLPTTSRFFCPSFELIRAAKKLIFWSLREILRRFCARLRKRGRKKCHQDAATCPAAKIPQNFTKCHFYGA